MPRVCGVTQEVVPPDQICECTHLRCGEERLPHDRAMVSCMISLHAVVLLTSHEEKSSGGCLLSTVQFVLLLLYICGPYTDLSMELSYLSVVPQATHRARAMSPRYQGV